MMVPPARAFAGCARGALAACRYLPLAASAIAAPARPGPALARGGPGRAPSGLPACRAVTASLHRRPLSAVGPARGRGRSPGHIDFGCLDRDAHNNTTQNRAEKFGTSCRVCHRDKDHTRGYIYRPFEANGCVHQHRAPSHRRSERDHQRIVGSVLVRNLRCDHCRAVERPEYQERRPPQR